ncbi:hypothetical protein KJZ63_03120 [Patescibacteria group bacterium]|nr:hypothetical protein [Patescibacteria group bacterium]
MPIRKVAPRKPKLKIILSLVALSLLALSLPVAYILVKQNQDLRQQAAVYENTCAEEDVNTQFRMYEAGTDKPWTDGNKMTVKVGDKIDVNCFAKTGTALLSNGKITLKIDGVATTIPTNSVINDGKSLKAFEITKGGVHTFTCANTASCSDTDQVNVPKTDVVCTADAKQCPDGSSVGRVAPNCEFAACPNAGNCTNPSTADLNKDCTVDLKDYDLFLNEFIKSL